MFDHKPAAGPALPGAARVFAVALAIRLAVALLLLRLHPGWLAALPDKHSDAQFYDRLALNLGQPGMYSLSAGPPYSPDVEHVPGYAAWLALLYGVFGHLPLLVIACQLLLGAAACSLTYTLAGQLTANPRVAWLAGLLLACDPTSIVPALDLMTETPYTLLLLLNVAALWRYRQGRAWPDLLLAAGWVAAAALVRSEAAGLALAEAVLVLAWSGRPWSATLPRALAFLAGVALLLAPWLARNWQQFRLLTLAEMGPRILLIDNAMLVDADRTGMPLPAVKRAYRQRRADYLRRLGPNAGVAAQLRAERQIAVDVLAEAVRERPWHYVWLQAKAAPVYWLPDCRELAHLCGADAPPAKWAAWSRNDWRALLGTYLDYLRRAVPWPVGAICVAWGLFLAAVYGLALRGGWRLWRAGLRPQLALLALPVLYLACLVQLATLAKVPRYRVPIMPYLMAAAAGCCLRTPAAQPQGEQAAYAADQPEERV